MSDVYLRLIPVNPRYVAGADALQRAWLFLRSRLPHDDGVTVRVTDDIEFVDQGGNFLGVFCPSCAADVRPWWGGAMDRAFEARFSDLAVTLPCCRAEYSLNDLRYDWPAGFARIVLEAMNPGVSELPDDDLAHLERLLATRLRVIWTRV